MQMPANDYDLPNLVILSVSSERLNNSSQVGSDTHIQYVYVTWEKIDLLC